MKVVGFSPGRLPKREEVSAKLEKFGWKLVNAENKYLTDDEWFAHLSKKEFPVTDFIREMDEIEFTPLPDMFHDFFGHLAFVVHPEILEIADLISEIFRRAPASEKPKIARIWWHTLEFGLIKENGEIKALGAGLISSHKELEHCLNPERQIPFDLNRIMETPKMVADVHQQFFVLESLEQLRESLVDLKEEIDSATTDQVER